MQNSHTKTSQPNTTIKNISHFNKSQRINFLSKSGKNKKINDMGESEKECGKQS